MTANSAVPVDRPDPDAIEARANAATEGPWRVPVANVFRVVQPLEADPRSQPRRQWLVVAEVEENAADAEFIAHAREDVPALLAEVERLRSRGVPR